MSESVQCDFMYFSSDYCNWKKPGPNLPPRADQKGLARCSESKGTTLSPSEAAKACRPNPPSLDSFVMIFGRPNGKGDNEVAESRVNVACYSDVQNEQKTSCKSTGEDVNYMSSISNIAAAGPMQSKHSNIHKTSNQGANMCRVGDYRAIIEPPRTKRQYIRKKPLCRKHKPAAAGFSANSCTVDSAFLAASIGVNPVSEELSCQPQKAAAFCSDQSRLAHFKQDFIESSVNRGKNDQIGVTIFHKNINALATAIYNGQVPVPSNKLNSDNSVPKPSPPEMPLQSSDSNSTGSILRSFKGEVTSQDGYMRNSGEKRKAGDYNVDENPIKAKIVQCSNYSAVDAIHCLSTHINPKDELRVFSEIGYGEDTGGPKLVSTTGNPSEIYKTNNNCIESIGSSVSSTRTNSDTDSDDEKNYMNCLRWDEKKTAWTVYWREGGKSMKERFHEEHFENNRELAGRAALSRYNELKYFEVDTTSYPLTDTSASTRSTGVSDSGSFEDLTGPLHSIRSDRVPGFPVQGIITSTNDQGKSKNWEYAMFRIDTAVNDSSLISLGNTSNKQENSKSDPQVYLDRSQISEFHRHFRETVDEADLEGILKFEEDSLHTIVRQLVS